MNKWILILLPALLLTACEAMELNEQEDDLYQREIEDREKIALEEENQLLMQEQEEGQYSEENEEWLD